MQRKSFHTWCIHFANTYSIWVVLGSFSTFLFFSSVFQLRPNYWVAIALALAIWIVYTLDHLLDGYVLQNELAAKRHFLHFNYKKPLVYILLLALVILAYLSMHIPSVYYPAIGVLFFATISHFIINFLVSSRIKKYFFLKEVFVALVVMLSFVGLPLVGNTHFTLPHNFSYYAALVFTLNAANLMLFSWYDRDGDQQTKTLSIASIYGLRITGLLIVINLICSFACSLALYSTSALQTAAFATLVAMQLTLGTIFLFPVYFKPEERYRFYGDLIYVYPLAVLPFL